MHLTNCHVHIEQYVETQHIQKQIVGKQYAKQQLLAETERDTDDIPGVFQTQAAQALLIKAQQAGMLDRNFQPNITKSEASLLAFEIATRLRMQPQWTPFEELWHFKNIRNNYSSAIETAKARDFTRKIEDILD